MPRSPPPLHQPPIRRAADWPALLPALGLMALGGLFILAPDLGALIFGLPAPEDTTAAAWIPVVGLRDLAFGGYVLVLAAFSDRRAVGLVLAVTSLIPVGDVLLLLALPEAPAAPAHLLAHAASGLVVGAAAAWMLRP
jgi:Domain of unknown function (DUF4267)